LPRKKTLKSCKEILIVLLSFQIMLVKEKLNQLKAKLSFNYLLEFLEVSCPRGRIREERIPRRQLITLLV